MRNLDELKRQLLFEKRLEPGVVVRARWTNSGHYYEAKAEVVCYNLKSFRVKLLEPVDGYPAGQHLNIPNLNDILGRWSVNNRLIPLKRR